MGLKHNSAPAGGGSAQHTPLLHGSADGLRSRLRIERLLDEGAYAHVYKGLWDEPPPPGGATAPLLGPVPVALKVLKDTACKTEAGPLACLFREAKLLTTLCHP